MNVTLTKKDITTKSPNIVLDGTTYRSMGILAEAENRSTMYMRKINDDTPKQRRDTVLSATMLSPYFHDIKDYW
jgi:hypothetical protein